MNDVEQQIRLVSEFQIDCVLVGGVAGTVHGSSIPTQDLDICYSRTNANLTKVIRALRAVNATLRGAPKDLPFILDEETLRRGLNFTFDTDAGKLDLLGEVLGVGGYDDCLEHADEAEIFGSRHRILSLEKLIATKRAAGRPKDLMALVELEAILEHRKATENTALEPGEKTSDPD
jgi:hypothetical protein